MNIYSAVDELSHRGYSVVRDFLPLSRLDPNLVQQLWSTDRDRTGVITDIPEGFKSFLVPFVGDLFNSLNPLDLHLGASVDYSAIKVTHADSHRYIRPVRNIHQDVSFFLNGALDWHLDHYSFFRYRDHTNYIICYMPVLKPSSATSNLDLIPYDHLFNADFLTYKRSIGRGAMRLRKVEDFNVDWFAARFPSHRININDWYAIDDYYDHCDGWSLDFDPGSIAVSPHLNAGDLLIMRADLFHKTGFVGTDRLSVRFDFTPKPKFLNSAVPVCLRQKWDDIVLTKKAKYALSKNSSLIR